MFNMITWRLLSYDSIIINVNKKYIYCHDRLMSDRLENLKAVIEDPRLSWDECDQGFIARIDQ